MSTIELRRQTARDASVSKGNLVGRIYPNGEFGYSFTKEKPLDEILDTLESTNASISHKGDSARNPKGRKGITCYSRRQVRNGAEAIQQRWGKSNCTFATVTLPSLEDDDYRAVLENWAELVRQFMQMMKRHLVSSGLPGVMVGVVEIQTKRMRREKRFLPLHLHFVFVGRRPGRSWMVTPQMVREYWARAIRNASGVDVSKYSWENSENLQQVRLSAANYLGKYMSKGKQDLEEVEKMGLSDLLPSHWSTCSQSLKDWISKNTHEGYEIGQRLDRLVNKYPTSLVWKHDVKLVLDDGREIPLGVAGLANHMGRSIVLEGFPPIDYSAVPEE